MIYEPKLMQIFETLSKRAQKVNGSHCRARAINLARCMQNMDYPKEEIALLYIRHENGIMYASGEYLTPTKITNESEDDIEWCYHWASLLGSMVFDPSYGEPLPIHWYTYLAFKSPEPSKTKLEKVPLTNWSLLSTPDIPVIS